MPHILVALVAVILEVGCVTTSPTPGTAGSGTVALTGSTAPAVDVDSSDCEALVRGRLFGRGGALWFEADSESATENEQPFDPSSWDQQAKDAWNQGDTLVTSALGTWSVVVPTADGSRGWVVRQDRRRMVDPQEAGADRNPGPDALGLVTPRDVEFRTVWSPGGELLLVGRVGSAAIVLVKGDGERFVAVAEDGSVVARSDPIGGSWFGSLQTVLPSLGLPVVAPVDHAAFGFRCGETELCIARVGESRIEVERYQQAFEHLGVADGALVVVRRAADGSLECLWPDDAPPAEWATVEPRECPEVDEVLYPDADDTGLPADGVFSNGIEGEAVACRVRDRVALPPLVDPAAGSTPDESFIEPPRGTGVVVLNEAEYRQSRLRLELLVRGAEVGIGFAFLDGTGAPTVRRDFGISLPPGTVEARSVVVDGRAMFRVGVDVPLPFPFTFDGDCWLGRLVVRTTWDSDWGDEQAFANRYWEFGVCD